jgi:hypothetical protein
MGEADGPRTASQLIGGIGSSNTIASNACKPVCFGISLRYVIYQPFRHDEIMQYLQIVTRLIVFSSWE